MQYLKKMSHFSIAYALGGVAFWFLMLFLLGACLVPYERQVVVKKTYRQSTGHGNEQIVTTTSYIE